MPDKRHGIGAIRSDPDKLAGAWPIHLALATIPIPAPAKYHSPKCQPVTIDQNGYGACVTYSGAYIQADQETVNEGRQLLPDVLDPLRLYAILKGLPYPFSPTQDKNPGLSPIQLWSYTKANGWPTKDGSPPRKDASYLSLGKPNSSAAFLDLFQQAVLQLGPVQFAADWRHNWYNTDSAGFMPNPSTVSDGGHAFETCGWVVNPDGTWHSIHHQSWGHPWGHDPEFPDHFRVRSTYWDSLGWESWKVADLIIPGYSPRTAMQFTAITPTRLVDSRIAGGKLIANTAKVVQVTGGVVPAGATAITGNLTIVSPAAAGWAVLMPQMDAPSTSTVNFVKGQPPTPNGFTIGLAPDGSLTVYSIAGADFILDVTGYFS